ncbi:SDR family oxidoreductase [Spelaeicoccus albus]
MTGATRGIGQAITEVLIDNGAHVLGLQRSAADSTDNFTAIQVDMGDKAAVERTATKLAEQYEVEILVNNAGTTLRYGFEEFPLDEFDQVMQVNLSSVAVMMQVLGRPMLERGHGKIINIASMLSFFGGFNASAYAASKGAVAQLTKSVANEWAERGVNVNAIAPGFIATELNTSLREDEVRSRQIVERIPAGRWGRPDDIASTALFLASRAAHYLSGAIIPVDGGYLGRS